MLKRMGKNKIQFYAQNFCLSKPVPHLLKTSIYFNRSCIIATMCTCQNSFIFANSKLDTKSQYEKYKKETFLDWTENVNFNL